MAADFQPLYYNTTSSGITDRKGTLDYGTDADFLLLDDDLNVTATYVGGECVYEAA